MQQSFHGEARFVVTASDINPQAYFNEKKGQYVAETLRTQRHENVKVTKELRYVYDGEVRWVSEDAAALAS